MDDAAFLRQLIEGDTDRELTTKEFARLEALLKRRRTLQEMADSQLSREHDKLCAVQEFNRQLRREPVAIDSALAKRNEALRLDAERREKLRQRREQDERDAKEWEAFVSRFESEADSYTTDGDKVRFAQAICDAASDIRRLGKGRQLTENRDYVAKMLEVDPTAKSYSICAAMLADELRLCELLCEGLGDDSRAKVVHLLDAIGPFETPLASAVRDLAFDIANFEQLADQFSNWKPQNVEHVRRAIEHLRDLAKTQLLETRFAQTSVKRFLRPNNDEVCIFTKWNTWFYRHQKESSLYAHLSSLLGRLGEMARQPVIDGKKNHDDILFWAQSLERPLIKFVDPFDRDELSRLINHGDATIERLTGNPLRVFLCLLICERDWFATAHNRDKTNDALGLNEGWVQTLYRYFRPTVGYSQVRKAYQNALAEANANFAAAVVIPKLEHAMKLHDALIATYMEPEEPFETRSQHNEALNDIQDFVEAIAPNLTLKGNEAESTTLNAESNKKTYPWPEEYENDKWIYENIHLNKFEQLSIKHKKLKFSKRWKVGFVRNTYKKRAARFAEFHGFEKRFFNTESNGVSGVSDT
jgi:hypothetical protein